MGLTYIEAAVAGPKNGFHSVTFLVDSGASYTVLPLTVWKKLGLTPTRTMEFILADGTRIKRKVSECRFRYAEREAHTPVVLGQEHDQAIAGTITLEILGLVLNPFDRTLSPMKAMMAKFRRL